MAIIVNSAWKSQKVGAIVKFKGEEYEIGSTAFGSLEAAVAAGETSDLVIVDKKLTSPVKKENITGAATDIFASTVKETESKDGKTYTKTVKFTAAAGGTASFKDANADLVGFEKVTATSAGGTFQGGKQDISSSVKDVNDSDKGIESHDKTAAVSSTAKGTLSVTGKAGTPSIAVAAIADSTGATEDSINVLKEAYKGASGGDEYKEKTAATYASVTLKNADATTAINGGVYTEKATLKESDTNGEKINKEYTYSATSKIGSGTATLTNANAGAISGFKTVKISTATAKTIGGNIQAGNGTDNLSLKTAYVADKSSNYTKTQKETDAASGTLSITGKTGELVTVSGDIDGFSSMNLKFANVTKDIESGSESENSSLSIAVKNQKDVASLTASYSKDSTSTADGKLTAANSTLVNIEGVKAVTISGKYAFGAAATVDATNKKTKKTKKETGVAFAGIIENAADYVGNFSAAPVLDAALIDPDQAYTVDYASKVENSVGGTTFKISGSATAASNATVIGYKTVNVDNSSDTNLLTATLFNDSLVTDSQEKIAFTPESSYSESSKVTTTDKAFGDATIKGKTTASANGFASVKVAGTAGKTTLNSVNGQNTESSTTTTSTTIKAGKENAVGNYTASITTSSKAATTLDVKTATIGDDSAALKTAKLQNVVSAGNVIFDGAADSDTKFSKKITWNAEEITATEAAKAPGFAITADGITAWTETHDDKTTAVAAFSAKNGAQIFTATANGFKSVDVSGTNTTLSGVTGQNTTTSKTSESLTVNATKGTYSSSETDSTQAVTTVTVNNAKIGTSFTDVKNVSLTGVAAAAPATFTAAVDSNSKSSKKFDWKAEEATLLNITTPGPDFGINNPSITSWTESNESKDSASGTFKLKNSSSTDATVTAENFKSIEITGAKDHTTVKGSTILGHTTGQDTITDKSSKSLSVNKTKGSYNSSTTNSSRAATTLSVTTANIQGTFADLKSVTLKDVKVAADTTFTASPDTDTKSSKKIEWNAEEVTFADIKAKPFDENVTSWTSTVENTSSIVGTFSLKDAANAGSALSISNFKTVEISGKVDDFAADSLTNDGDHTDKTSLKRTASETKRAQEYSHSETDKTVGSLKLTGDKDDILEVNLADGEKVGYSSITLKNASITTGGTITAESYDESSSYTAKESASLDSGSPVTVDLKVSSSHSQKGNGSFSATSDTTLITAFNGTLKGYSSISLKGKVKAGSADNYKYDGGNDLGWDLNQVPFNGEYFDVIAVKNGAEVAPGDAEPLLGNISGSYTMDKSGQITSKWTGSYAKTANGSYSQTTTDENIIAGNIAGYDKVTLTGVKTIGTITGTNTSGSTVLNYKYAKDEAVANSKVVTVSNTSASGVSVTGQDAQVATVGNILGYKSVVLNKANATGTITAVDQKTVTTTDKVNSPDNDDVRVISKSVGTLKVTSSTLADDVTGFGTVTLEDTVAANTVDFTAGDSDTDTLGTPIANTKTATGSFSSTSTEEQLSGLYVVRTVGNITGFEKVTLQDTKAQAISVEFAQNDAKARATAFEIIAADDELETPKIWKKAGSTKNNAFTASADHKYEADTITTNEIVIGAVTGYNKVEATGLDSIGTIENAFIQDSVDGGEFATRLYGNTHYGDWTATATEEETKYAKIEVATGSTVKVNGVVEEKDTAETAVTGNILGYSNVKLDTVKLGSGAVVNYAGGRYTYTTKTNSNDEVIATSTNTADGKLEISNATFKASSKFKIEGFKAVAIDIKGAAVFQSIIGGTEVAQFIDGTLDYSTFTSSTEKLSVTTEDGSVEGGFTIAGFQTMEFTDTNIAADIIGYDTGYDKSKKVQTYTAKATITFDDTDDGNDANTIAGDIINAKSIVFKSSKNADDGDDFTVTGNITSETSSYLAIEIDKSQVSMAFANFDLNAGDVLNFVSDTADASTTATLNLGAIDAELTANVWEGVSLTGTGTVKFSGAAYGNADLFKTALKDVAKATVADTITFVKG